MRHPEDAFRCPGCEVNNGTGRLCGACRKEMGRPDDDDRILDDEPPGGWHPPEGKT